MLGTRNLSLPDTYTAWGSREVANQSKFISRLWFRNPRTPNLIWLALIRNECATLPSHSCGAKYSVRLSLCIGGGVISCSPDRIARLTRLFAVDPRVLKRPYHTGITHGCTYSFFYITRVQIPDIAMPVGEGLSSATNSKEGQDVNYQVLLDGACSSESSRTKPTRKRCVWISWKSFMLDSWVLEMYR